MPDDKGDNGRYREGQRDAQLSEIKRRLTAMEHREVKCKGDVWKDIGQLRKEINEVKVSVAKMAGVFSLVGGVVGGIGTTLGIKLFGG